MPQVLSIEINTFFSVGLQDKKIGLNWLTPYGLLLLLLILFPVHFSAIVAAMLSASVIAAVICWLLQTNA